MCGAPLSVAQGYLRLLREHGSKPRPIASEALAQSMEALGRIGRLCEDAAAFVAEPRSQGWAGSAVRVSDVVDDSRRTALNAVFAIDLRARARDLVDSAGSDLDRVIQSLPVILCAVRRSTRNRRGARLSP